MDTDNESEYDDYLGPDMSDENLKKYNEMVCATGGYDVEYIPVFAFGLIVPLNLDESREVPRLASMAIDYYNKHNHTEFKMVEVIKGNVGGVSGFMYYITFKAEDANNGKIGTFQGRVWDKIPGKNGEERIEVEECRIKPPPPPTTTTT